jgi:VWFA-related protein
MTSNCVARKTVIERPALLLGLGLMVMLSAGAQQNVPMPQAADNGASVIRVNSKYVLLDALVENKKTGNLIGNLDANDFVVAEDGSVQRISYFSRDELPLSVVFLFDLTETVRPILKPLAQGALAMLGHLKPQDEVSVMVFSSHTELLQGFTTDRGLASAAIEKASGMESKDGTFIHEDMYEAVDQAMKSTAPQSRRVLVWLTDGTANLENSLTQKTIGKGAPAVLHSKAEATAKLVHSGVVVSALIDRSAGTDAFIAAADISPLFFLGGGRIGDIREYAELTGGPVLKTSKQEVAAQLSKLIDQLRARYTLGYQPSMSKPDGDYCKLTVRLAASAYGKNGGVGKSDLVVLSKRGYYR